MQIDIGVTVRNRPQYTKVFFESLINCLNSDYRLFIFDDASDQESQDLIEDYCKKNSHFVKVRSDENVGNVCAKKTLLETMESKYIVQTDNDIILSKHSPDLLQRQIQVLDSCPKITCIVPRVSDIPLDGEPKRIVLNRGEEIFPNVVELKMYGCLFQMQRRDRLIEVDAYNLLTKNKWDGYEFVLARLLQRGKRKREWKYGMFTDIWIALQDNGEDKGYKEKDPHWPYKRTRKSSRRCLIADEQTLEPLWHKDGVPSMWWKNKKYYRV